MIDIELKNISKSFGMNDNNEITVLKNLSLLIPKGKKISISGTNGSGKSTLLKIIDGSLKPDNGNVLFNSEDVTNVSELRRSNVISKVHQNPSFDFAPNLTLFENFTVAKLKDRRIRFNLANNKLRRKEIESFLSNFGFGILITKLDHTISEFSGGQKQIVSVLMALICSAKIFLFDEPTSNLDAENLRIFLNLIKSMNKWYNPTVIFVSHNSPEIIELADEHYILVDGKIVRTNKK
jgi:putative tryptophan/tyrosine transport system ATP-binding protein